MKQNITDLILVWVECCRETWNKWFRNCDDIDSFSKVECALYEALIEDKLKLLYKGSCKGDSIYVSCHKTIVGIRQFCRSQRAGNIVCKGIPISMEVGTAYKIKSIDPLGTMMEGEAYAEVFYEDGFVLEPVRELHYFVNVDDE